jgi:hypothetical protein
VLNSEGAQEESVVWMSDFRSTPFSLTQESLHIIQKYYPGLIAVAILTNPPRIFESFWKVFVDTNYTFSTQNYRVYFI